MVRNNRRHVVRPLLFFLSALTGGLLLTGCWDRTEINDLAIVTSAAFDAAENNQIRLSIQMFVPSGTTGSPISGESGVQGGGTGGTGNTQVMVMSAVGSSSADAATKLQRHLSRNLFWGQADTYIFGEALARRGIGDPLDFLIRHPSPRERANLFVAKGTALHTLHWRPAIERNSAEVLREMTILQTGLNITLLETNVQLTDVSHTALIPWITIRPKDGSSLSSLYINGAAAFDGLKMKHFFDSNATRGLMWLRNEIRTATITIKNPEGNGTISLRLLKSLSKQSPSIRNGEWHMRIRIQANGTVDENSTSLDLTRPENVSKLENAFEQEIIRRVSSAVESSQQIRTDVVGFAEKFHRRYPQEWKRARSDWDSMFPEVKVAYDVDVTIMRTGLIGKDRAILSSEEPYE